MSVAIHIPPSLQAVIDGVTRVEVDGATIGACLHKMVRIYPRLKDKIFIHNGRLPKSMNIYINGKSAGPRPLEEPVHDGDKVYIAYIVLGG